ncbi:MAG: acetoacetate--CoA ligase [Solirubrobacteraceae bacterium]
MKIEPVWRPSEQRVRDATLSRFMHQQGHASYDSLYAWSVGEPEQFWQSIWDFFDVQSSAPHGAPLSSREMPGARWFEGARLNYAEHIFRGRADDQVALLHASELRELSVLSWGELRAQVARCAAGLRRLGVERGDRVVAYVPNIPEALVGFLASASIGAIWSSCSPDFGARSVLDRFAQIEPTVLLAVDGYRYGGRDFDRRALVHELAASLPTLKATVVIPYLGTEGDWSELLAEEAPLEFEQVEFAHPLWVLYSSGTTGLPKAILHGHGGILLEQLKQGYLHMDLNPGERVFWFTTTGWMMWNFLIGCLLCDAQIVLYDGNPGSPDLGVLWRLAESAQVTCFGTSAGFITACMKAGLDPGREHDLGALRAVGSTGSPLPSEGFGFIYEHVGSDLWLFSTSGGTDVCTAFVGGNPLLPVYRGELQCRMLGSAVEAWDEQGRALVEQVGELVITQPMPSMPIGLWGDTDGSRYRESYFEMYPGVWRHGDWIRITDRGTAVIYGRSDATINRQGVRMGTSEIYSAVLALDEIADALVVDVPRGDGGDLQMHMFVVLSPTAELDDDLRAHIKRRIREDCSPRHTPDAIHVVAEIPRTLSGKVLEVPVKKILMGVPLDRAAQVGSLANPDSLQPFVELAAELRAPAGQTVPHQAS